MILHDSYHDPVLLPDVLDSLKIKAGNKYIDATLGGGGYSLEIISKGGTVLGIDRDQEALDSVKDKINKNFLAVQGNFADLKEIAGKYGFLDIDGIIFDLGMSTHQLEKSQRGFSYLKNEPLDMRMDIRNELTAGKIINTYSREKLYEIFTKFAEEIHSRTIVEAIIRTRTVREIKLTGELTEAIGNVLFGIYGKNGVYEFEKKKKETLARIFQALRIEVNSEIENLKKGLIQSVEILKKSGRLVILSYHSLEDREVKLAFRDFEGKNLIKILTKAPIRADYNEIKRNSKAKSAKLRIGEKK